VFHRFFGGRGLGASALFPLPRIHCSPNSQKKTIEPQINKKKQINKNMEEETIVVLRIRFFWHRDL
jgi:hypothetical protein